MGKRPSISPDNWTFSGKGACAELGDEGVSVGVQAVKSQTNNKRSKGMDRNFMSFYKYGDAEMYSKVFCPRSQVTSPSES